MQIILHIFSYSKGSYVFSKRTNHFKGGEIHSSMFFYLDGFLLTFYFCRTAYMTLVHSIPQANSITDLLSIPPPPLTSFQTTEPWPKASEFSTEELKKFFWSKSVWNEHKENTPAIDQPKGKKGKSSAAAGINVNMQYGKAIDGY
jgi:hypothetical protein